MRNTYLSYLLELMCRVIIAPEKNKPTYSQFFTGLSENSDNLLESTLAQLYYLFDGIESLPNEVANQSLSAIAVRLDELLISEQLKSEFILMHLNYHYGNLDKLTEYADKYLEIDKSLSSPSFPTMTRKRIDALDFMQQCDKALELSKRLQNRMMHETIEIRKYMCDF